MGAFYVSFLFSLSYLIAFGFMLEVYQALVLKKIWPVSNSIHLLFRNSYWYMSYAISSVLNLHFAGSLALDSLERLYLQRKKLFIPGA